MVPRHTVVVRSCKRGGKRVCISTALDMRVPAGLLPCLLCLSEMPAILVQINIQKKNDTSRYGLVVVNSAAFLAQSFSLKLMTERVLFFSVVVYNNDYNNDLEA